MSNTSHLRQQAGGDPARAVSDDLKNPTKAPQDGNDFPDAPADSKSSKPQDKPDLDAFAEKLGTDTIETGEALDAVPDRTSTDAEDVASAAQDKVEDAVSEAKQQASDAKRKIADAVPESGKDSRVKIAAGGSLVAAVFVLIARRRSKRNRVLAKAAALGAAVKVIGD